MGSLPTADAHQLLTGERGDRGGHDIWAVGEDSTDPGKTRPLVLHWNGSAWRVVPGPAVSTGSFGDVTIGPDGKPWMSGWPDLGGSEHAVVYRYAGGKWQPLADGLEQSINANALTVISKNDAWLPDPGLAHFDGKSWKVVDDLPTDGSQIPTALKAVGPKNIWLVGVQHTGGPEGERRWPCTTTGPHGSGSRCRTAPPSCTTLPCATVARWPWANASRSTETSSRRTRWSSNCAARRSSPRRLRQAPNHADQRRRYPRPPLDGRQHRGLRRRRVRRIRRLRQVAQPPGTSHLIH